MELEDVPEKITSNSPTMSSKWRREDFLFLSRNLYTNISFAFSNPNQWHKAKFRPNEEAVEK